MRLSLLAVFTALILVGSVMAASTKCTPIKSGTLLDSSGNTIGLGYDQWGYNYQANMFNGWYDNNPRPSTPVTGGDWLMMKWNNAWLSNVDCDGDSKLDRHFGFPSYVGSGAWLTNHAGGSYDSAVIKTYNLVQKDSNWNPVVGGASGLLTYSDSWFEFAASGLIPGVEYSLIYYPDPWPGNGCVVLGSSYGTGTANATGGLTLSANEFPTIPIGSDTNGPDHFKIWLVPASDISCPAGLSTWNPSTYLFELNFDTHPYVCAWDDFVKIVAVPADATLDSGYWYSADGAQIGPEIWGQFVIIQEISNDPCGEFPDLMNYSSSLRNGLGNW